MRMATFRIVLLLAACPGVLYAAGRTELSYDGGKVEIIRDEFGVPHVFAEKVPGAFYGQGWVCAEDRGGQLEKYRLDATGAMAEFLGERYVGHDETVRRDTYSLEERRAMLREQTDTGRRAVQAFCDGVNAYWDQVRQDAKLDWPEDIQKAGYEPRPFTPEDTLAIGAVFARRFGEAGEQELEIAPVYRMLRQVFGDEARAVLDDLVPLNDPRAPTTANDELKRPMPLGFSEAWGKAADMPPAHNGSGEDYLFRSAPRKTAADPLAARSDEDLALRADLAGAVLADRRAHRDFLRDQGLPFKLGSNAWVIAPNKSATGRAMLFGGPMMGFRTPQIAYEVHLSAPGLNVMGMTFAGVPGVLIGFNEHLGFTTTSAVADFVDFFEETLHPDDQYRYRFNGEWREMEKRTEIIKVRGQPDRSFECYRTVHGPVVEWRDGTAISCQRSYWKREFESLSGIFEANFATNLKEFERGIAKITTSHNFLVATKDGEIGWWYCGLAPIRHPEQDVRFLTPGDGSREWQGMLPFEKMPRSVNPKEGYLGNWNNKPSREWDLLFMGEMFWGHEIYDILKTTPKLTHNDFAQIAYRTGTDIYYACYLRPYLRDAFTLAPGDLTEFERPLLSEVMAWDSHEHEGSLAFPVFMAWFEALREAIFDRVAPGASRELGGREQVVNFMLHALDGPNSGVKLSRDYLKGEAPAIVRKAWHDAVRTLREQKGDDLAKWAHRRDEIRFTPLPSIPEARRGTWMQVIEVGPGYIHGESCLPPGQSENPDSPHYGDQREMFQRWSYKEMILDRKRLERRLGLENR